MNDQSSDSTSLRLVVLGSPRVGKSSLISVLTRRDINRPYKPTVGDSYSWQASWGGRRCRLDIIDASGSNDFPAMRRLYISTGKIFLLVHSLQDPESFEEVLRLLEQIKEQRSEDDVLTFVVGNKADRRCQTGMSCAEIELRLIDYMEVVRYFESNALHRGSVDNVFASVFDVVSKSFNHASVFYGDTLEISKQGRTGFMRKWKSLRLK